MISPINSDTEQTQKTVSDDDSGPDEQENQKISEFSQMLSMGLPVRFGRPRRLPAVKSSQLLNKDVIHRNHLQNRVFVKHHNPNHILFDDDCNAIIDNISVSSEQMSLSGDDDLQSNITTEQQNEGGEPDEEYENKACLGGEMVEVADDEFVMTIDSIPIVSKRKKKKKRKMNLLPVELPAEIENDKSLLKYWYKRFSLFSRFDQGIKLDRGKLILKFSF